MDDEITILYNAELLRRNWGLDNLSPFNILSVAQENIENLTVLWFPMIDEVSGCCSKTKNDNIICINSRHPKGRQNFTFAHEIYHLLFDDDNDIFSCMLNSENIIEKNADKFAEFLLIPKNALLEFKSKNDIDFWSLEDIIKCEQYFQISHTALLHRLIKEDMITFNQYNEFKKGIIKHAINLGYDAGLYQKSEKEYYSIGKIIPLIEDAFENDKISKGKHDEMLLNIFRSDIVYNLNDDDLLE